ncbi:MAG: amidohydrolase family protein [Gemmatimonadales bacterium]|nr:amidohydrolase family protein [Gemmatimonadales bacterium]
MIVDCHVHLNNYQEDRVPTLDRCLADLLASLRRNRVDFALVLTSYKVTPGRPSTREVVMAIRDIPFLAVVAGLDYTTFTPGDLAELREYVQAGRVRGLKLYPGYQPFYPNDPKWTPAYEFAGTHGIPVMIHTGDTYTPKGKLKYAHPLHVDDVAVDFPDVRFVICHLGNPWIRDCMEVVYKNANVYTDISGLTLGEFEDRFEVFMRKQVQEMLLYGVEPDAVLFGTDWPISSLESYLDFMSDLAIPERDRRKIMGQNAAELFRLDPRDSSLAASGRRSPAPW